MTLTQRAETRPEVTKTFEWKSADMVGRAFPIDRRDVFKHMEPYLAGQGGVLRVGYLGEACAPNVFVEVITSLYENSWTGSEYRPKPGVWRSVRLGSGNYKVKYLPGILSEFFRKMEIAPPNLAGEQPSVQLGKSISNNVAFGKQHIQVSIYQPNHENNLTWTKIDDWIASLRTELKKFLQRGRFMVIVTHGNEEDQGEFWDGLWDRLSDLTSEGLLLVRMVDDADSVAKLHPRAAHADLDITLVHSLIGDQIDHAIEDVTEWMCRWRPEWRGDGRARAAAETHVWGNEKNFGQLHENLLNVLRHLTKLERV